MLAGTLALLEGTRWPERDELQELMDARRVVGGGGAPLRLVPPVPARESGHAPYELRIFDCGEMEHRDRDWHDLFNALVWLTLPSAKAALNARHAQDTKPERSGRRSRIRDALTLLDEEGVLVLSDDESLLGLIREFRWKDLFWRRRADVRRRMLFVVLGHALYHKALQPYVGMVGRAILMLVENELLRRDAHARVAVLDARLAGELRGDNIRSPQDLHPLPMLGIPGWFEQGEQEAFYDNRDYFRPGRRRAA
jgi:hypothetical protein